jgi:hypothetical protein
VMAPAQAAALVVMPSFVTNVWHWRSVLAWGRCCNGYGR